MNHPNTKRVALIGIHHESNTFLSGKTTYQHFVDSHLLFQEEIRQEYARAHHEIGGILEVFDDSEVEIFPLLFAEATPGGVLTAETYEKLRDDLIQQVQTGGPWDGLMVCAHGAAVAEGYPDMDGDWIQRLREIVGKETPIVATIDPHANVSKRMAGAANAIVAYSTNPHIDQRETGRNAARLLLDHLSGKVKLTQALCQTRVSISIEQQNTSKYPCRMIYEAAEKYLAEPDVLSVSVVLGFPYSDVEKMGSSFIAVTDNDPEKAGRIVRDMGDLLEAQCTLFVGLKIDADAAIDQAMQMDKPVLVLDMGDNVGGGSPGDGTILLHSLARYPKIRYCASIYDPEAVEQCWLAGEKAKLAIPIGGKSDDMHGAPRLLEFTVQKLQNGIFKESEPRHGGQVNYDMGKIALVAIPGGSTLLLMSKRVPPFSLSQLTTFGVQPERYDVIIAKGVQAPIAAYAAVCPSLIWADTPGVTRADVTQLPFNHRRKPLFPFEELNTNL